MKKILLLLQGFLLLCIIPALFFSFCEIAGAPDSLKKFNYENPKYDGKEDFDPSLQRLNTLNLLFDYCDSLYSRLPDKKAENFNTDYTNIVRTVIRKRFYHGYSTYGFGNNYIALLGETFYKKGISSIVMPDEIIKYPFAACSQQSIVMMKVLQHKGFVTRKVGFPPVQGMGHFCVEVKYNKSWHFMDADMEPDLAVLKQYHFPDAAFLKTHEDIVRKAYANCGPERATALFRGDIFFGSPNTFPAKTGRLYHKFSRIFSYCLWLILGIVFFLVRKKYLLLSKQYVRNRRVYFPQPERKGSSSYYPGITAPGS